MKQVSNNYCPDLGNRIFSDTVSSFPFISIGISSDNKAWLFSVVSGRYWLVDLNGDIEANGFDIRRYSPDKLKEEYKQ